MAKAKKFEFIEEVVPRKTKKRVKGSKICKACDIERPLSAFNARQNHCRGCHEYSTWSEQQIHIEFIRLLDLEGIRDEICIFHPANGEKRDKMTALNLFKMGVVKGAWDAICLTPNNEFNGFLMEFKDYNGIKESKLSDAQILFEQSVNRFGKKPVFDTVVVVNPTVGVRWVKDYLCR